jgi:hypothetical protein
MRLRYRLLIAIPLALAFLAADYYLYQFGFFMGGMATDSCSNLPGYALYYLEYLWPVVMGIFALVPSALIIAKLRWRWVWVALIGGFIICTGCYCAWFPILSVGC